MITRILNVKINTGLSRNDVLKTVDKSIKKKKTGIICTTNSEFIVDAQTNREFNDVIEGSLLSIPDGVGVLMAASYLNSLRTVNEAGLIRKICLGLKVGVRGVLRPQDLGERITGVDLMDSICAMAEKRGYTVFILGGWPKDRWGRRQVADIDLATKTKESLLTKYPKLRILGATSEFSYKTTDDKKTLNFISRCMQDHAVSSIDIVFVAYNHVNQELWLKRNMHLVPAIIGMGVGGSLDFLSGSKRRAPYIMQRLSLEWFYRLLIEPWRIKRIVKAFPYFPYLVAKDAIRRH